MEAPKIHYDHFLGVRPEVRRVIAQALNGDISSLQRSVMIQGSYRPSLAISLQASYQYAHCGQQVYVVGPKYQRMFADTPCDHIPDVFFKLPHDCFYIALPNSDLMTWEPEFGYHQVAGLYVYRATPNDILFIIWGKENEKAKEVGDDTLFWLRLEPDKTPATVLDDGVRILDLDQHVEDIISDRENEVSDPGLSTPDEKRPEQIELARTILRIAINTILHLNGDSADTERDTSRPARKKAKTKALRKKLARKKNLRARDKRKAQVKLDSMSEAIVIWLGRKIENNPKIRVPRRGNGSGGTWLARKGHRHHYWVGKRHVNEEGKRVGERLIMKWVAPVYRMPGDPDAPTREHRFIGEKEDYTDAPKG